LITLHRPRLHLVARFIWCASAPIVLSPSNESTGTGHARHARGLALELSICWPTTTERAAPVPGALHRAGRRAGTIRRPIHRGQPV